MSDQTNKSNSMQISNNPDALLQYKHRILSALKKHGSEDENDEIINLIYDLENLEFSFDSKNTSLLNNHNFSSPYQQHVIKTQTDEQLMVLKDEINDNESKIHDFKISLAEAIIENRSIKIKAEEQSNLIKELEKRILYLDTHSKSSSLDSMSVKKSLAQAKEENKNLNINQEKLEALIYELKQINATKSTEIKSLSKEKEKLQADLEEALLISNKLKRDLEYQGAHSKTIKQRLDASEMRKSELSFSVSSLQQEKNHLQMRVNNLITGLNKEVLYSNPNAKQSEETHSILAPSNLPPYIPFCFPERLPRIILMKQDASLKIPATLKKNHIERSGPAQFHFETNIDFKIVNRIKKYRHTMQTGVNITFPQPQTLFDVSHTSLTMKADYHKHEADKNSFRMAFDNIIKVQVLSLCKLRSISLVPVKSISNSNFPHFFIEAYSISLYIAFLCNRIFHNHYFSLSRPGTIKELRKGKSNRYINKLEVPVQKNIYLEKLALRHSLNLKFKHMNYEKEYFAHSFVKQSKLKTVLKTFENAISSIVKKYDSFSPPTKNAN